MTELVATANTSPIRGHGEANGAFVRVCINRVIANAITIVPVFFGRIRTDTCITTPVLRCMRCHVHRDQLRIMFRSVNNQWVGRAALLRGGYRRVRDLLVRASMGRFHVLY